MSGLDDFMQGIKAFDEGITQFAVGKAISGAKDQMDQLNQSAMNEMERRAELEKISKGLTLQLGGLGAPVSQIQSAVGAVAPKALGTPGAALWEGIQTGSDDLQKLGQQGLAAEESIDVRKEDRGFGRDMKKLQFQRETALMEAGLRAKQKELKPISDAGIKAITEMEDFEAQLTDLKSKLSEDPGYVGPARASRAYVTGGKGSIAKYAGFEAQAKRLFDTYRRAVTGAGASNKELEDLEKSMPNVSERSETYQQKLGDLVKFYEDKKIKYFDRLKRAGRDTSEFEYLTPRPAKSQGDPGPIEVKTLKDGTRVKVQKDASGNWVEVQ